jgi:uncharacterized protein YjaZ
MMTMRFNVLDIPAITRRLLDAPTSEARTDIFQAELVQPFAGLTKIMGQGMDAMAALRMWGLWPEQYEGESSAQMVALLDELTRADAFARSEQALYKAQEAFTSKGHALPDTETVFALCLSQQNRTNPSYASGYSGFGAVPGWAMVVYWLATPENLRCVESVTAHEMHHNILATLLPPRMNVFQINVGDYMVMEGLAESFASELYGTHTVGPWVDGFSEADMQTAIKAFRPALTVTGFGTLRQYIFGDATLGIPTFSGYALGYKVVQAYLAKTGCSVVDATFVEPATLIAESGVFAE